MPRGKYPRVTHPSATVQRPEGRLLVRLACVKPAANVRPEPGSNSQVVSNFRPKEQRSEKRRPKKQKLKPGTRHRRSRVGYAAGQLEPAVHLEHCFKRPDKSRGQKQGGEQNQRLTAHSSANQDIPIPAVRTKAQTM